MKLITRLSKVTPYSLFCRQVSDNIEAIRASQAGVEQFFPVQYGGLFGQKSILDEEEVVEMTEFDGADRSKVGATRKYV